MTNNKIKAVIFDIGRVLVEVNLTQGIFKFLNMEKDATDLKILNELLNDHAFIDFSKGKISPQAFYNDFVEKANLNIPYEEFVYHWQNIFKPIKGMAELTDAVSREYEIGILSDIDILHWQRLKNELSIFKKVKKPTLSFEVGYMKPQREIYEIAAENVGQCPENCLFIDDREVNVKGAVDAGMKAVQFKGKDKLRKDLKKVGVI